MRKFIAISATIALLTVPAYAQSRGKGSHRSETENSQQTQDKKKKDAEAEKAYKNALKSIPDQKISDPWVKMR